VLKQNVQLTSEHLEVRTRSVPTAAALLVAGFPVLRVISRPDGQKIVCISPADAAALLELTLPRVGMTRCGSSFPHFTTSCPSTRSAAQGGRTR
jgi:hypothetical protein